MSRTRTGSFPIAFRKLGSQWQQNLAATARWARDNGFEAIDTPALSATELKQVTDAGIRVGSVDLKDWQALLSPDAGKRKAAVQANIDLIQDASSVGARIFFTLIWPEDINLPRAESFKFAVESYGAISAAVVGTGARIVIEGWPGPGPLLPMLACNPETYRALIREVPGGVLGVNFDPSHLIRMFIDPLRFAREFAQHIYHVHGKDTEIFTDDLYDVGVSQPAAFKKNHAWGGAYWRYTLPGHGCAPWPQLLAVLKDANYSGYVSVELEDENFNGSEAGEQRGLIASRDYLAGV